MPTRPDSELTWQGRPILTVPLAAARYGVGTSAVRMAVARGLTTKDGTAVEPINPPPIDDRTPAWWQDQLDEAWGKRVGRGANLRGHS